MARVQMPVFSSAGTQIGLAVVDTETTPQIFISLAWPYRHTTDIIQFATLGMIDGLVLNYNTKPPAEEARSTEMPNQTTYVDERTSTKTLRALTKDGALDLDQALGAVERLQDAGLLIREPMRKDAGVTGE